MRTFLILTLCMNAGAAIHASDYRPMHIAAVVLSLAVLGLVAWLRRVERGWCENCGPESNDCCVCK